MTDLPLPPARPVIDSSYLTLALLDALRNAPADALKDAAHCVTVLPAAESAFGLHSALRTLRGASAHRPVAPDDGAPDIRNASAWLTAAVEQLGRLAVEHNDARLADIAATLSDIAARGAIAPASGAMTRAAIVNGTGFAPDARFVIVPREGERA